MWAHFVQFWSLSEEGQCTKITILPEHWVQLFCTFEHTLGYAFMMRSDLSLIVVSRFLILGDVGVFLSIYHPHSQ